MINHIRMVAASRPAAIAAIRPSSLSHVRIDIRARNPPCASDILTQRFDRNDHFHDDTRLRQHRDRDIIRLSAATYVMMTISGTGLADRTNARLALFLRIQPAGTLLCSRSSIPGKGRCTWPDITVRGPRERPRPACRRYDDRTPGIEGTALSMPSPLRTKTRPDQIPRDNVFNAPTGAPLRLAGNDAGRVAGEKGACWGLKCKIPQIALTQRLAMYFCTAAS